jgi:hypothetical protein
MQQVEIVAASCKKGKNYWGSSLVAGTSGYFSEVTGHPLHIWKNSSEVRWDE